MEEVLLLYKVSAGSVYVAIFEIHREHREAVLKSLAVIITVVLRSQTLIYMTGYLIKFP